MDTVFCPLHRITALDVVVMLLIYGPKIDECQFIVSTTMSAVLVKDAATNQCLLGW